MQRGDLWWADLPDPGNVLLASKDSGLPVDSVVNISQVITLDRALLTEYVHSLPAPLMAKVEKGLRLVLQL